MEDIQVQAGELSDDPEVLASNILKMLQNMRLYLWELGRHFFKLRYVTPKNTNWETFCHQKLHLSVHSVQRYIKLYENISENDFKSLTDYEPHKLFEVAEIADQGKREKILTEMRQNKTLTIKNIREMKSSKPKLEKYVIPPPNYTENDRQAQAEIIEVLKRRYPEMVDRAAYVAETTIMQMSVREVQLA